MSPTRFAVMLVLALSVASPAAAQDARAETVLDAARHALGVEKLQAIKGLVAKGKHRRSMGEIQANGETEIDITLPDKYLRSQTDRIFGNSVTMETGFEGDEPIQRANSVGGGPNVVFRTGGPNGPGEPLDPATLKAAQLRAQHADFTRLMLGWFASAPAFMEATYTYAGEAESPDGRADVIEIKGRDNFAARLFIDQQTHRPLMLTYMGPQPVTRVVRRAPGGHPPARTGAEQAPDPDKAPKDALQQEPAPIVEMQVYFDDYRKAGDVWLPYRISRSVNGQPNEEIEFDKIQLK